MGQRDGQRHERWRVLARIPEHEALIAGTLKIQRVTAVVDPLLVGVVDPLGDVGDCFPMETETPQDSPSKPFTDES